MTNNSPVNSSPINPQHYKTSKFQAIEMTECFDFNVGNCLKYLWRAGLKDIKGSKIDGLNQDLEKAIWYLKRAFSKKYYYQMHINHRATVERLLKPNGEVFTDSIYRDHVIRKVVSVFSAKLNDPYEYIVLEEEYLSALLEYINIFKDICTREINNA